LDSGGIKQEPGGSKASRLVSACLCAAVAAAGFFFTRGYTGLPSVAWLFVFNPADFPDAASMASFFWSLRVPVPPVWALLEILTYNLTGSTALWYAGAYRLFMTAAFVLAVAAHHGRWVFQAAAALLGVLFLAAAPLIHTQNPQLYDIHCALLLCLVLVLFNRACERPAAVVPALLAGLAVALLELTRPFFVLLLPLIALFFCMAYYRQAGRRPVIAFLAPILLLSGGWQAHQLVNHGQLTWSNHGGYNLLRPWPMFSHDGLLLESETPSKHSGPRPEEEYPRHQRWLDLNNEEHGINSRRIAASVVWNILAHPVDSALHFAERLRLFASAPLVFDTYFITPPKPLAELHPFLFYYRLAAAALMYSLPLGLLAALVRTALQSRAACARMLLGSGHFFAALVLSLFICLHALTEMGEEFRFVVTLLPALLLFPGIKLLLPPAPAAEPPGAAVPASGFTLWGLPWTWAGGGAAAVVLAAAALIVLASGGPSERIGEEYDYPDRRQALAFRDWETDAGGAAAWIASHVQGENWSPAALVPREAVWRGFRGLDVPEPGPGEFFALGHTMNFGAVKPGDSVYAGVVANGTPGAELTLVAEYQSANGEVLRHANYFKSSGLWKKVEVRFTVPSRIAPGRLRLLLMRKPDTGGSLYLSRPGVWVYPR